MTTIYDIDEMQATIERQRIALEKLLEAVDNFFATGDWVGLHNTFMEVSSASTMTGTSEK